MNSTATKIESRPAIDAVRGEFFCVGEGRRVDSRSPWPGAGGSHFRISAPRRRGKSLPNQTASASLGGLAWVPFVLGVSTEVLAARLPRRVHGRDRSPENPKFFDSRRPQMGLKLNFFRYLNSYGRRVDSRSPWPGTGGSRSGISPPRRRGKGLPNQTAFASLGDLAWVPFVHGVSTEVLTVRLPRKVHGRDRSLEIFRFPEAPNGTQAELSSVGIADFFRHLNSYTH